MVDPSLSINIKFLLHNFKLTIAPSMLSRVHKVISIRTLAQPCPYHTVTCTYQLTMQKFHVQVQCTNVSSALMYPPYTSRKIITGK